MKRFLFSALMFTAMHATAQDAIEQPRFVIGGSLNAYKQSRDTKNQVSNSVIQGQSDEGYSVGSRIYVMKQLNVHWSAGIQLSHQLTQSSYTYELTPNSMNFSGKYQDQQIGAGLMGRYMFNPANKLQFGLVGNVTLNRILNSQKEIYGGIPSVINESGYGVLARISPTILWNVNRRLRVTAELMSLQYQHDKLEIRFSGFEERQDSKYSYMGFSNFIGSLYVGIEFKL